VGWYVSLDPPGMLGTGICISNAILPPDALLAKMGSLFLPRPTLFHYIARREARDATLALPERMIAALQVNLRGGALPAAEDDGHSYLKMPVNRFAPR